MELFGTKLSRDAISLLHRQLGVMLATGVSLDEAFNTLAEESEDPKTKRLAFRIKNDLAKGISLGDSFAKYPNIFSEALINILSQEDQREKVSKVLFSMADALEGASSLKSRILRAIFFPALTFVIAIFLITLLIVFVIPVFIEMFASFGGSLPVPTQFFLTISIWVTNNILYIIIAIAILVFVFIKNKKLKYQLASIIPRLGVALKKSSVILFTRHLSIMLSFDIPLEEAIRYSSGTVNNALHAQKLKNMGDKISDAKQLKEKLHETRIFPKIIIKMVDAGIKSNSLELVFEQISKFYEKDIDQSLNKFTTLVEIVAIFIVGILVGGFVISMYLPIFKMAGGI
jgi:type IV pilus assembly protein PilC